MEVLWPLWFDESLRTSKVHLKIIFLLIVFGHKSSILIGSKGVNKTVINLCKHRAVITDLLLPGQVITYFVVTWEGNNKSVITLLIFSNKALCEYHYLSTQIIMVLGVGDEGGARIDSSTFSAPQDSIPYRDTRTGKNTNTQLQYSLYWLLLRLV